MIRGHGRALEPSGAHEPHEPHEPDQSDQPDDVVGDGELLRRVRAGDETAYGELWARHARAARCSASRLVPAADVEDIVSEAFERTLTAIRAGNGPHTSFSSYVAQTMRSRAATMYARRSRVSLSENDDDLDTPVVDPDPFLGGPARDRVVRAFKELPPRWQDALWVSVVEAEPPRRVAARLGTSPNGVSALVIRARRRLRDNFIDLSAAESRNPLCSKAIAAPRRHAEHLNSCDHCSATIDGLAELDVQLNARGAGLAAILAIWAGRVGSWHRWARHAMPAVPVKAVAAVVVVTTAGAALTPFVIQAPTHRAPTPVRASAPAGSGGGTPAAAEAEVQRLSPSPTAPTWSTPPATRRATTAPPPTKTAQAGHHAAARARPMAATARSTAGPTPGPQAPPSTPEGSAGDSAPVAPAGDGPSVRTGRPLSLDAHAQAACACAQVTVRGAHRPDVVRVQTHQKGAADSTLVLHPEHPGVLHLSVPRSGASRAPMVVTVSVTRRRSETLVARTIVRAHP